MILLSSFLFLAIIIGLLVLIRRLIRERDRFRRIGCAWQDYACAVEVAFECEIDCNLGWEGADEQGRNAERAAQAALAKLQELGEYPDAWECNPFLPYDEDDDE